MYRDFDNNACRYSLRLCVWLTLFVQSIQFPRGLQDKRFNIEAVPAENDTNKILLHLKSRHGSIGLDGPMGDRGPLGTAGIPGLQGVSGDPGFCPVEMCNAIQEASLLAARVEALENLFKHRVLHSDVKPTESPLMALHIISDILLTRGNVSNGKVGIPGANVKVNIDLKNAAPLIATNQNGGNFLVNSTVQLLDRSKVAEMQSKSAIARTRVLDGVSMTEQQFQTPSRSSIQQEVPSIKKSRIPVLTNPQRLQ